MRATTLRLLLTTRAWLFLFGFASTLEQGRQNCQFAIMNVDIASRITSAQIDYFRAYRCWKSNDLSLCAKILEGLVRQLNELLSVESLAEERRIQYLKQLIYFLKIKCFADLYYIDEPLLLNEDEIVGEERIKVFTATSEDPAERLVRPRTTLDRPQSQRSEQTSSQTSATALLTGNLSRRSGVITGRMTTLATSSSRANTSYRPLTTSIAVSQSAFSRSTRPLLRHSTCPLLSKLLFSYLYNVQSSSNRLPDYRQCLEYLHLVYQARISAASRSRKQASFQNEGVANEGPENRERDEEEVAAKVEIERESSDELVPLAASSARHHQFVDKLHSQTQTLRLGAFWLVAFGKCYFNLNMLRLAEENFRKSLECDKKYVDAYTWLIKVYLRRSEPLKVLATCEDGLAATQSSILKNWLARAQSIVGKFMEANTVLLDLLRLDPTNFEALANVGHYSFYGGKFDEALRCFERIELIWGQDQLHDCFEADVAFGSQAGGGDDGGELAAAASLASEQLAYSSTPQLQNNLALCYFYSGFYHRVVPAFQRALVAAHDAQTTSDIWYNLSFVALSSGLLNLAVACLQLAVKLDSQNKQALNNLAVMRLRLASRAAGELHFCSKLEPPLGAAPSAGDSPAEAAAAAEAAALDEAEACLSSALPQSVESAEPEALFNLALVQERRGELRAAAANLRLYAQRDPANYAALQMLREIRGLVADDTI